MNILCGHCSHSKGCMTLDSNDDWVTTVTFHANKLLIIAKPLMVQYLNSEKIHEMIQNESAISISRKLSPQ